MRYNMERKQEVVLPRDIAKSEVGVGATQHISTCKSRCV